MLRHAKISAEWTEAPDRDAIKAKDHERLLSVLLQPVEIDDADRDLAQKILAERSPEEIAAMLVQAHRAKMPEPEELIANTPEARREAQKERHRPGFEDIVWFRMNIGRRQNADPRWVLPLLCRRGHITRNEIGAIRIAQSETFFQIPRAIAGKFEASVQRTGEADGDEENIVIELSNEAPREVGRTNRKHGDGNRQAGRPGNVRPHRKGAGKPKGAPAPDAGKFGGKSAAKQGGEAARPKGPKVKKFDKNKGKRKRPQS